MIQRIQSVWLLLAAVATALTFKFPFYSGTMEGKQGTQYLLASSNFFLLILTVILTAGCLILIFLYKERKRQLRLTIVAILVSILILVIYFFQLRNFDGGAVALTSILSLINPVLLFLAAKGIRHDEKLIKSLDRLR